MLGSSHCFSEVYLHCNWHCIRDSPLLSPELEPELHDIIRQYCACLKGVHLRGIGGTETHVHLVIQIEPYVAISDLIGKIKGRSAHDVNEAHGINCLQWQRGYGVVSFAARDLPGVLRYVERQKEHHRNGTTRDPLEAYGDAPE